jgi:acyl-[acyl-carrier-protein] desaturase
MHEKELQLEVMKTLEQNMDEFISSYLTPIDKIWQPSDFLPDSSSENFKYEIEELQTFAREMPYDLFVTLIGDCITEEALPTYESWLMGLEGVDQEKRTGWTQWVRA